MKKILFFSLFIVTSIAIFPQVRTINVVCEDRNDFPNVLGEGRQILWDKPGISVDVLLELEKRLEIEFDIIRQPWARCLESLKTGSADALFVASHTPQREEIGKYPMTGDFPNPELRMNTTRFVFYILKDDENFPWNGSTLGELNGAIGIQRSYSMVGDLLQMGADIEESLSTLFDYNKLIAGRLRAVVTMEANGDYLLNTNPELSEKIVKFPIPIRIKPQYLIFSHDFYKGNRSMAERIWEEISRIRSTGQYDSMLKRYLE